MQTQVFKFYNKLKTFWEFIITANKTFFCYYNEKSHFQNQFSEIFKLRTKMFSISFHISSFLFSANTSSIKSPPNNSQDWQYLHFHTFIAFYSLYHHYLKIKICDIIWIYSPILVIRHRHWFSGFCILTSNRLWKKIVKTSMVFCHFL